MKEVLSVQSLTKFYDRSKAPALRQCSLSIAEGEIVAITGESGCGKTTLLRLISGLETPDEGHIFIGGQQVAGLHAGKPVWVKPEHRKVGMVFQDYALFPHLNVGDNICFGLNNTREEQKLRLAEMLQLVGLEGYERRFPHELSGGQQQRVALARALAPQPFMLLLDEPFSNLDEVLKEQLRDDLLAILRQSRITTLMVTHDTGDALATADKIAVLKQGSLQQYDAPEVLYGLPANLYVAQFFGKVNILQSKVEGNRLRTSLGYFELQAGAGAQSQVCVRPEDISIYEQAQTNTVEAKVQQRRFFGAYQEYILVLGDEQLTARTVAPFSFAPGSTCHITCKRYNCLS